jgi:CheY-like chemotaxis protein
MPEMDGIEATHRIREIGTDYAQTIPIIALTANAIAGNEEMFLNKGFQAFIPKPIDLIQLDSVIRLFIRDKEKEKQHFNKQIIVDGNDVPDIRKGRERRVISLRRCGLDRRTLGKLYYDLNVKKGLKRFDGDKNVYMSVLRSFAVNTKPTLEKIKGVNKANLTDYVISVHGIKGSSRGIFAEVVGKQAEALEKAAKADDFDFVSENNPDFVKMVDALITDIETMLQKVDEHVAKPQKEKPDQETLTRLLEACKKYEMDGVDAAIEELERYEYESDGELVAGLRRSVDETDFAKIIETLSYLEK